MDTILKELLRVEDRFLISGRGLILVPDFPMPPEGRFRAFSERVLLARPDGSQAEFKASFQPTHFRLLGGASRWAVVALLIDARKEDVPIDSVVYSSGEAASLFAEGFA